MKKYIYIMSLIVVLLMITICKNIAEAKTRQPFNDPAAASVQQENIKTQLARIINTPFDVEVNDNTTIINLHSVILTTDNYLKNKLFSIASYLVNNKIASEVIIIVWQGIDSNYAYKAAMVKDDMVSYNKGLIDYATLFSRMKIVKSELARENNNLEEVLETPPSKLTLSPAENLVKSTDEPALKPKIPPESFYSPILKPLISEDFNVISEENYVTVNIAAKPIETSSELRNKAYDIMRRVIGVNPSLSKIVINWQPEEGCFGKTASLAGIYIKDFFLKKITPSEIKEVIFVSSIEPTSRHLNEVLQVAKIDIPIENLRRAKELREAATIYTQNKKYDSAIRTYKQAIKLNPNDYLSYYWLGEIYIIKENFKEAQECLNKSLGLNPEFRKADETLAKIKLKSTHN